MNHFPWGVKPEIEWDEENVSHFEKHRLATWEVDELILSGDHFCTRHPKWRQGGKYSARYMLKGKTMAGRRILVLLDRTGARTLRPVTGWDD